MPLVRHLRARLLLGAVRRRGQHRHAGQPGHRRARRHAALQGQGRDRGLRRRHPSRRRLRHQRSLPGRDALQRRLDHPPDLRRRRDHRLRAVQRALGGRRRNGAGLVRHHGEGPLRRGSAHPAGAHLGQGPLPERRRAAHPVQHARAGGHGGRPRGAGGGHAGLRARDPAARRQVLARHDRDRVRRGAGLRREPHPDADRRAARRRVGDRGLPRLRPDARGGADPDQGADGDRGRPDPLRPHRARTRRSGRS